MGRYGSGGRAVVLAVEGLPVWSHPGRVEVSLSETPNPQLLLMSWLVPCMAANRRWCVNVCVNGWMRGIHCKELWIKALYKCSPFTIYVFIHNDTPLYLVGFVLKTTSLPANRRRPQTARQSSETRIVLRTEPRFRFPSPLWAGTTAQDADDATRFTQGKNADVKDAKPQGPLEPFRSFAFRQNGLSPRRGRYRLAINTRNRCSCFRSLSPGHFGEWDRDVRGGAHLGGSVKRKG